MHLLVIRTSAMGDVALTTPVLRAFITKYPSVRITLLTRKTFAPFFHSMDGLELFFPDFKQRHRGFAGIIRLYCDIKRAGEVDIVLDLHDVLRSKLLRFLFRTGGAKVYSIDKGRREKRRLIRGNHTGSLKHSVTRYCEVFENAGYGLVPYEGSSIHTADIKPGKEIIADNEPGIIEIGVAPFAKHPLKAWPVEYMTELLGLLSASYRLKIWLFGGYDEREKLEKISSDIPGSVVVAGLMSLEEELALIARLRVMIAMDSSNMHMAALSGTRVISIWGGTDPATGFGAWGQPEEFSVSISRKELSCRPCTVFGKGKCRRGDFACMMWLTPQMVFEKIKGILV